MLGFNLDGLGNDLTSVFNNLKKVGADDERASIENLQLTDSEANNLFRGDGLIQKIICKYPDEAKTTGYKVLNTNGEVLNENDSLVLEAFTEASIQARLYRKAYLVFHDEKDKSIELTSKSTITSFQIYYDLVPENQFYKHNNDEKIHVSRVYIFIGSRTYIKDCTIDNPLYSDSILQGLYSAFQKYKGGNDIAYFILCNLSYLCLGIEGLGSLVSSKTGQATVLERLMSVNINRSITRILAFDKTNEKVDFASQSITGFKDLATEIKELLVAVADYPLDQIFETSPNQSLGSGVSNQLIARMLWAKRVNSWITKHWYSHYVRFFKLVYGNSIKVEIPFDVDLTELEKAELENLGADRIKKLIESGVISISEARTGYKGSKYTLNIDLDENYENQPQLTSKPTESPSQTEQREQQNTDAINDSYWDALSTVTEEDVLDVAKSVLKK